MCMNGQLVAKQPMNEPLTIKHLTKNIHILGITLPTCYSGSGLQQTRSRRRFLQQLFPSPPGGGITRPDEKYILSSISWV